MAISYKEIRQRAIQFSSEWKDETRERAEGKTFLDQFFEVFGVHRRRVSTFETKVRTYDDADGYIDLLWKGMLLVELKSRGFDLDKAYEQAKKYTSGLSEEDIPKYILVSDFTSFRLFDLEDGTKHEFQLKELYEHITLFNFILGYQKKSFKEEDPVNIKAAELMGKLHDKLKEIGYSGHNLEVYLVRLVFCMFADDTSIFEKGIFQEYIERNTKKDGSDLAQHLSSIFQILNEPQERRMKNLDDSLTQFPFVNGLLFEEQLPIASFDSGMWKSLMECCRLDWGKISPAIFGSLFQSVMDEHKRRNLGAHYTSEKNILKLIKPLFLDALWEEFEQAKGNSNKLRALHEKLSRLRFLDPACGCGNFLIITYRELRLLEMEIIRLLLQGQQVTDISTYFLIDVDQFYGIECEEFPSQIAQLAMWLIDHQMNMRASEAFGEYYIRLPLKKSATIIHGNALRIDWSKLIEKEVIDITSDVTNIMVNEPVSHYNTVNVYTKQVNVVDRKSPAKVIGRTSFHYIFGNPPFAGKQVQSEEQKKDLDIVYGSTNRTGILDYVTAWYFRAAQYMQIHNPLLVINGEQQITCAFVSTNSISQGEQVGVLWSELYNKYKIRIHFAHRTFKWSNEAKGNAAVHVVIIGFANYNIEQKRLFEYHDIKGEPHEVKVRNINPYLVDGKDVFILSRTKPLCKVPEIIKGSETTDDGHFMLSEEEVRLLKKEYPEVKKFIRPFVGGGDFINGNTRWCLWLKDASSEEIRHIPFVVERIERVKNFRLKSPKERTKQWAQFPTLFSEDRQPTKKYLLLPKVSSERRKYIPFAYLEPKYIVNNTASTIPDASPYLFGVLESQMHMTWMSYVCGRMKSDYIYSNKIVYNNFPWPENPSDKQKNAVEKAAQHVLDMREQYPESTLADLYDPNTMPPPLVKAHQALDKTVDLCYRSQPYTDEANRIAFLFELYGKYTAGLFADEKKRKKYK